MLRVALLVLACAALAFAQQQCCASTCVNVGDTCNYTCPDSGDRPACLNSHCSLESNTCVDVADLAQDCSDAGDGPECIGSHYFPIYDTACLASGKCGTALKPQNPGDPCSLTEGSVADASTSGGCSALTTCDTVDGTCTQVLAGQACSTVACQGGYFCDILGSGQCEPDFTEGQDCSGTFGTCLFNLVCSTGNQTCDQFFQLGVGETCGDSGANAGISATGGQASLECQLGLACLDGACADPDDSFAGDACETDNDCNGGVGYLCLEAAACQPAGNFCVPIYTRSDSTVGQAYQAYANCIADNNCTNAFFTAPPFKGTEIENCQYTNCFSQWQAYVDSYDPDSQYTECTPVNPTTGTPTTGTPTGTPTTGTPTGTPTTTSSPTGTPTTTSSPTTGTPTTANPTTRATTGSSTTEDNGAAGVAASVLLVLAAVALML